MARHAVGNVGSLSPRVEFRILGPVQVWDGDRLLAIPGEGQRALLALLLLNANRVQPTERLIDELWGEEPPGSGAKAVQVRVSQLRRTLAEQGLDEPVVITRSGGYVVEPAVDQLDLHRFERLTGDADEALGRDEPSSAADRLREALGLWRGPALADFDAPFARSAGMRLEELRLAALERRIEAELALGSHRELIGELEELTSANPFREALRAQLMVALYRSRRQADALNAYREARRVLVNELGIEPSQMLQELEQAILSQDPSLELAPIGERRPAVPAEEQRATPQRSVLVVPYTAEALPELLAVAEPLARRPRRELILIGIVGEERELETVSARFEGAKRSLADREGSVRVAAFTSSERGSDLARFASEQNADLLLVDAPPALLADGVAPDDLDEVWSDAPCDVAVLVAGNANESTPTSERPVVVPFGGSEHEWGAVELGAWIAASRETTLHLLGSARRPLRGKRDASRLLARVSLIVQRSVGVTAKPVIVPPGEESILAASKDAGLLVLGLSERYPSEGLGAVRLAVAKGARPPTLLVRRGIRPGGLAPPGRLTRFTWSLSDSDAPQPAR